MIASEDIKKRRFYNNVLATGQSILGFRMVLVIGMEQKR